MAPRLAALFCAALPALAAGTITTFGYRWQVPVAADWKVETAGGMETLWLLVPRPNLQPRRPTQFALADTPAFIKVTVEAEVKKEAETERNRRTSLLIVYAYKDPDHYNYAHLSVDSPQDVAVHNGIFHVYGGERVRISRAEGPGALTSEDWHKVKLTYDGTQGRVEVLVNGKHYPSLQAVDMSLGAGKVGLGSFFDMGSFRNVKIDGVTAR